MVYSRLIALSERSTRSRPLFEATLSILEV